MSNETNKQKPVISDATAIRVLGEIEHQRRKTTKAGPFSGSGLQKGKLVAPSREDLPNTGERR